MKYKILNEFENSKELNPEDGSVLIFMFSEIKIYNPHKTPHLYSVGSRQ